MFYWIAITTFSGMIGWTDYTYVDSKMAIFENRVQLDNFLGELSKDSLSRTRAFKGLEYTVSVNKTTELKPKGIPVKIKPISPSDR